MNEINYKGEKPERIVYYHKTENINMEFIYN